ncbi:MAG: hypothetical protein QM638_18200 [Nocardioides sp.]|uniref:hypothetical protein n=1 Tax=Nocardioides sp. TaxID=35761 RepID=UPI0039E63F5C
MSHDYSPPPPPPDWPPEPPRRSTGRTVGGWAMIVLGVLIVLGALASLANGDSGGSSGHDAAYQAGAILGRVIVFAVAAGLVIGGTRLLRRR